MKIIVLIFILLSQNAHAASWWTSKKGDSLPATPLTQLQEISQKFTKRIHLYQVSSGKQAYVQSGLATVISPHHLITASSNVSKLGQSSNFILFVQNQNKMLPCEVQYLDLYNGVALIHSSDTLIEQNLDQEFDFSQASNQESLKLIDANSTIIQVKKEQVIDDGIREFFRIQTLPTPVAQTSGAPVMNEKLRVAGIYLGKTQGGNFEFYIPLFKLAPLFNKAKLTKGEFSDPAAPQRQFQNQIKAYQNKFINSLINDPRLNSKFRLANYEMTKIPNALECQESTTKIICSPRLPLMIDPATKAFDFQLEAYSLFTRNVTELKDLVQELSRSKQNEFQDTQACRQFRVNIRSMDTQLHFCLENAKSSGHLLLRAVMIPQKDSGLLFQIHSKSLPLELTRQTLQPFLYSLRRDSL